MLEKPDRLHFMDSMRATLMILGVVLHSASVFDPRQAWVIYSNNSNQAMEYLVNSITLFRMPAFFVVSGYFCYLTLKKYKVRKFLNVRLQRIVVPLVFTVLTLNLLQLIFLDMIGWSPSVIEYIRSGGYLAHLWFLVNLLVYFIAASLIALLPGSLLKAGKNIVGKIFDQFSLILIVFAMPVFSIMIMGLAKTGFPLYYNPMGFFDVLSILTYTPFFVFGVAVAIHKGMLQKFSTINPLICIAIIIFSMMVLSVVKSTGNLFSEITIMYFKVLAEWTAVLLCFFVFYRFFNTRSKISRLLSESSYSIYLLHHIFVVMLAALFIRLDVSAIPGTLVSIVLVTAITLLLHTQLISKNRYLLFFFNGKWVAAEAGTETVSAGIGTDEKDLGKPRPVVTILQRAVRRSRLRSKLKKAVVCPAEKTD